MAIFKECLPNEVIKKIEKRDDIEIIDVREPEEWVTGHISQAKHIPIGEIPDRFGELNKNKETIVICQSGNRSSKACEYLSQLGFNVINMTGGMNHWTGEVKRGE